MLQRIKQIGIKKIIRWMALFLLSTRMFLHLFYSPEKEFQIFKDIEFYCAIILFMVILAIYRRISLVDWRNWLYVVCASFAGVLYFKLKDYRIATLDVDCFRWMVLRTIMQFMFLGLMLDLVRKKNYKELLVKLKSSMVIFYILTAILFLIFDNSSVYPLICPIIALLFTEFSERDGGEMAVLFSLGIYAAFVKVFTGSLIEVPVWNTTGRYTGYFLNIDTAAVSCATAAVACLFLFYVSKEKKNKKLMVASLIAMAYPVASMFTFQARGTYLGLILILLSIYMFMHAKGDRVTFKRIGIVTLFGVIGIFVMLGVSLVMNYMSDKGILDLSKVGHFFYKIAILTSGGSEDDYYKAGTILNAIDNFSSGRLPIWEGFIKQIRFLGHPIENLVFDDGYVTGMAHNFFLQNLVRFGILGGGMYIIWYILYIVRTVKCLRNPHQNLCAVYTMFWLMYMLAIYMTEAEFFNCTGAFMLLVSMWFVTGDFGAYSANKKIQESKESKE